MITALKDIREALLYCHNELQSDSNIDYYYGQSLNRTSKALTTLDSLIAILESDELVDDIVERGIADFNSFDRKGGYRGQGMTKWDDTHYWIAQAAINIINGKE